MLILARKENEEIKLGDNVVIKIVSVSKNGVKIGIQAPKDMMILRGELIKEISDTNLRSSQSSQENLSELSEKLKK